MDNKIKIRSVKKHPIMTAIAIEYSGVFCNTCPVLEQHYSA